MFGVTTSYHRGGMGKERGVGAPKRKILYDRGIHTGKKLKTARIAPLPERRKKGCNLSKKALRRTRKRAPVRYGERFRNCKPVRHFINGKKKWVDREKEPILANERQGGTQDPGGNKQ